MKLQFHTLLREKKLKPDFLDFIPKKGVYILDLSIL